MAENGMPSNWSLRCSQKLPLLDRVCIDASHNSQPGINAVDPEGYGIFRGKLQFNLSYYGNAKKKIKLPWIELRVQ